MWSCTRIERDYLEPKLQLLGYKLFLKVRHHSSRSTQGPGPPSRSKSSWVVSSTADGREVAICHPKVEDINYDHNCSYNPTLI